MIEQQARDFVRSHFAGLRDLLDVEDKAEHSIRVGDAAPAGDSRIAGYLHDILEEPNGRDGKDLMAYVYNTYGFGVLSLVAALTRNTHESYFEYVTRVADSGNEAIALKVIDIKDNIKRTPSASMLGRYAKALEILNA